jgi:hypothetical protein
VHELGRHRRSAAGQIVHFAQENRIAPPGRVARDTAPVDAAADDSEVENLTHGRIPYAFYRKILVLKYLTAPPVFNFSGLLSDFD